MTGDSLTLPTAMALLDCFPPASSTVRGVRAAWAAKARLTHPDTAPDIVAAASANLARLSAARDLLLAHLTSQARQCKVCRGTGKVRGRVGATECVNCDGTGEKLNG